MNRNQAEVVRRVFEGLGTPGVKLCLEANRLGWSAIFAYEREGETFVIESEGFERSIGFIEGLHAAGYTARQTH